MPKKNYEPEEEAPETNDAYLNIYERMEKIRAEVPYIQKDKAIKMSGGGVKFNVVSSDNIIRITRPLFEKYRVGIKPTVKNYVQNGNRTEILLDVIFYCVEDSEDNFMVTFLGLGVDNGSYGSGIATTYAFRYAILKTLYIETGEDPEDKNPDFQEEPISEEQLINLREICESYDVKPEETLRNMAVKVYRLKKIDELPAGKFEDAQARLNKRLKEVTTK